MNTEIIILTYLRAFEEVSTASGWLMRSAQYILEYLAEYIY